MAPQSAITFSVYTLLNGYWDKYLEKYSDQQIFSANLGFALKSTINGALSGIISKSLVYPIDVCKKRLQIQGFENARISFGKTVKYNGLLNCIKNILKYESFFGLYKGYWPSMIKAAISSGSIFFLYEEITALILFVKRLT